MRDLLNRLVKSTGLHEDVLRFRTVINSTDIVTRHITWRGVELTINEAAVFWSMEVKPRSDVATVCADIQRVVLETDHATFTSLTLMRPKWAFFSRLTIRPSGKLVANICQPIMPRSLEVYPKTMDVILDL